MARLNYEYGLYLSTMANVESLITNPPFQSEYQSTTVEIESAAVNVIGHGWGRTELSWGFITQADRNALKTVITERSRRMYWRVKDDSGSWMYVDTITVWPEKEPAPQAGRLLGFKLELRILSKIGASSS